MMRRVSVVGSAVVACLLALTACTSTDSVSVPIGPVSFTVTEQGDITVVVGAQHVTRMGTVKVGVKINLSEIFRDKEYWLLRIRVEEDAGEETVFQLTAEAGLRIESDGRIVGEYWERDRVVIVPAGESTQIDVTELGDDDDIRERDQVFVVPDEVIGTWGGTLDGGNLREPAWSSEGEQHPQTDVTLRVYGGELGSAVGEFSYPEWGCTGVVVFDGVYLGTGYYGEEEDAAYVRLRQVILDRGEDDIGRTGPCGGFIIGAESRADRGLLQIRAVNGELEVFANLERTDESGEVTNVRTILR